MNLELMNLDMIAKSASVCVSAFLVGCGSVQQLSFDRPEDAVQALRYLAASRDASYGEQLFGPDRDELLSGDADVDAFEKQRFAAALDENATLREAADGSYELVVGRDDVPFPVPIIEVEGRWLFDTREGVQRLIDLRVGTHEIRTIEALRAIHTAQLEYRERDHDGDGVLEFAPRLLSSAGRRDGLYWPTTLDQPNAPLGAYYTEGEVPISRDLGYYGYFYKVLERGATQAWLDASGNLVGGFAVLAYPAIYDETGVMTFLLGQDGQIRERDLGDAMTRTAGRDIDTFAPDTSWVIVAD